jgi:hypothetical protein
MNDNKEPIIMQVETLHINQEICATCVDRRAALPGKELLRIFIFVLVKHSTVWSKNKHL